jgi:hypothetical protein
LQKIQRVYFNMKKSCTFVIGPESSGSTYIAQLINQACGNTNPWSGRGFNCCDDAFCDQNNGHTRPCSNIEPMVCHRSLPFAGRWPNIDKWNEIYDAKYVICTRDWNISQISHSRRFNKEYERSLLDKQHLTQILKRILLDEDTPSFIWSYETYLLLGRTYMYLLADFLAIERSRFDAFPPPKNGNIKYINQKIL